MKQLLGAFLFVFIACSPLSTVSAQEKGDIVIMFDQSASMQKFTPLFMADLWISTFTQTFAGSHTINLVGFSQNVTEHARIEMKDEPGLRKLREYMQKIQTSGLITDFEPPLKYLLEYPHQADLIVFITDGKPDIWDEKEGYLSKKIRKDKRYAKLNSIYDRSRSHGKDQRKLIASLKPRYEKRNLELIKGHLIKLRKKFGNKIVFLDVSGEYGYLPVWSDRSGARYVSSAIAEGEAAEEKLKKSLVKLQTISGEVLGKPLPAALDQKIESILDSRSGAKMPPKEPTSDAGRKTGTDTWKYGGALLLLLLAVSAWFIKFGKKKTPDTLVEEVQPDPTPVDTPQKETEEEPPDFGLLDDSGYIAKVRKTYRAMASTSLEAARRYIEKEISLADSTGNLDKLHHLRQMLEELQFNRRFSFRVNVAPGVMNVLWKDLKGADRTSPVQNVSFTSLLFEEPYFSAGEIYAIECAPFNIKMGVKSSRVKTRGNRLHVVILDDFEDAVTDRMHWIEILTRIEEVR